MGDTLNIAAPSANPLTLLLNCALDDPETESNLESAQENQGPIMLPATRAFMRPTSGSNGLWESNGAVLVQRRNAASGIDVAAPSLVGGIVVRLNWSHESAGPVPPVPSASDRAQTMQASRQGANKRRRRSNEQIGKEESGDWTANLAAGWSRSMSNVLMLRLVFGVNGSIDGHYDSMAAARQLRADTEPDAHNLATDTLPADTIAVLLTAVGRVTATMNVTVPVGRGPPTAIVAAIKQRGVLTHILATPPAVHDIATAHRLYAGDATCLSFPSAGADALLVRLRGIWPAEAEQPSELEAAAALADSRKQVREWLQTPPSRELYWGHSMDKQSA